MVQLTCDSYVLCMYGNFADQNRNTYVHMYEHILKKQQQYFQTTLDGFLIVYQAFMH
jgi:hypothetical protein